MNLRITTLFFGILLTTLWVFGLLIAQRKTAVDQSYIIPSLRLPDTKIDKVLVQKNEKDEPEIEFVQKGDHWFLTDGKQQVRVEGFRIEQIITQIKDAKHEESSDVPKDPGLTKPRLAVTLVGKYKDEPKQWKFLVGKESADKNLVYVGSPERPEKAFAVAKKSIENLFFKDPNYLRSKRIFDFSEPAITTLELKKDGKDLELKRSENNLWTFVKPPLGFAGFDNPPEERKEDKFHPKPPSPAVSGVKSLLNSVAAVRVDDDSDFVPLGKPMSDYGLETDKAKMRFIVTTSNDKKEATKEMLLIGDRVPGRRGEVLYYGRLSSDDGVMQINEKWLKPLVDAINAPGKIRSLDIAVFEPKNVDAVTIKQGKEEIKFFKPDVVPVWEMYVGSEQKKADQKAVQKLIEQMQGKNAIVAFEFDNLSEAELKKREAEVGLDASAPEIAVYVSALEKAKKDAKEKQTEKKKEVVPTLKKDAKPVVKLTVGKTDKDVVHVKRTLQDGTVSHFTLKKEFVENVLPPEGPELAYLSIALPSFTPEEVRSLDVVRTTDKGVEKLDLEKRGKDWYVKDPLEPTGAKLADSNQVGEVVKFLADLHAKKWLQKIDAKTDLDKFGLKEPAAITTFTVKKNLLSAKATASLLGSLALSLDPILDAMAGAVAHRQADPGEKITIKFGKETDQPKDKPGVFAQHSGSDLLFLVPPQLLHELKTVDLRDRSHTVNAQPEMIASLLGNAAADPINLWMLASPYISGKVLSFDPDKVKEVRFAVRTPYELRSFGFTRNAKDKTWTDAAGLQDFQLDTAKLNVLLKDLSNLKTDRFAAFAGGPRSEHKLGAKEAAVKIDLTMDDGKTITLSIGASYKNHGYFANASVWPETVFFVPSTLVEPLLRGVAYFSKERAAAAN